MNTDILREELLRTFADNPHEMLYAGDLYVNKYGTSKKRTKDSIIKVSCLSKDLPFNVSSFAKDKGFNNKAVIETLEHGNLYSVENVIGDKEDLIGYFTAGVLKNKFYIADIVIIDHYTGVYMGIAGYLDMLYKQLSALVSTIEIGIFAEPAIDVCEQECEFDLRTVVRTFLGVRGISGGSAHLSDNSFVLYLGIKGGKVTTEDLEVSRSYFSVAYELLDKEGK